MAEFEKNSDKESGWSGKFKKAVDPEQLVMIAHHTLDIALSNAPATPELKLLNQAPFIIVGCFNASDIPLTTQTLSSALDKFANPVMVAANLEEDAGILAKYSEDEDVADTNESGPYPIEADNPADEDNLFMQQMRAKLQKHMAINQKVVDAMAPTIRGELGLAADAGEYDTYHTLSETVTRGFAQLLEAALPGATTDPNHDIWKIEDGVGSIVRVYRQHLEQAVLEEARGIGMSSLAKPANPNPMS